MRTLTDLDSQVSHHGVGRTATQNYLLCVSKAAVSLHLEWKLTVYSSQGFIPVVITTSDKLS